MRKPRLNRCPFCGGRALYGVVGVDSGGADHPDFGGRYIQCGICKASSALMFPIMEDVDEALADAWNSRA